VKIGKKFWAALIASVRARTIKHGGGNYAAARGTEKKCGEGPSIEQINAAAAAAPREIFIHTGCAGERHFYSHCAPATNHTRIKSVSASQKCISPDEHSTLICSLERAQPNYIL
jgi:hypothetical protein